jgi:hypothetical protein
MMRLLPAARNSRSPQKKNASRSFKTVGVFLFVPIAAEMMSLLKEAG